MESNSQRIIIKKIKDINIGFLLASIYIFAYQVLTYIGLGSYTNDGIVSLFLNSIHHIGPAHLTANVLAVIIIFSFKPPNISNILIILCLIIGAMVSNHLQLIMDPSSLDSVIGASGGIAASVTYMFLDYSFSKKLDKNKFIIILESLLRFMFLIFLIFYLPQFAFSVELESLYLYYYVSDFLNAFHISLPNPQIASSNTHVAHIAHLIGVGIGGYIFAIKSIFEDYALYLRKIIKKSL